MARLDLAGIRQRRQTGSQYPSTNRARQLMIKKLGTDDQLPPADRFTVRCSGRAGMFDELGHFAAGCHRSPHLDLPYGM